MKILMSFLFIFLSLTILMALEFTSPQIVLQDNPYKDRTGAIIDDVDYDGDNDVIYMDTHGPYWMEDTDNDNIPDSKHYFLTATEYCSQIKFTDFNNDNIKDIVVKVQSDNRIYFLVNDGSGNFMIDDVSTVPHNYSWTDEQLYVYDFNNDGIKDVYWTCRDSAAVLTRNNLTNSFTVNTNVNPVFKKRNLSFLTDYNSLCDFDDDGCKEIFGINSQTDNMCWLDFNAEMNGTSVHDISVSSETGENLSLIDWNNDSYKDIVCYNPESHSIVLYLNDSLNNFTSSITLIDSIRLHFKFQVANLDNDSLEDLIIQHGDDIWIFKNSLIGFTQNCILKAIGMYFNVNDIDDDGFREIMSFGQYQNALIYHNDNGEFNIEDKSVSSFRDALKLEVFNFQGTPNVIVANNSFLTEISLSSQTSTPFIFNEILSEFSYCHNGCYIKSFDYKDIDNNGIMDYVVSFSYSGVSGNENDLILIMNGQLSGTLDSHISPQHANCEFVDMDCDDDYDIICISQNNSNVIVYENIGNSFSDPIVLFDSTAEYYKIADLNNDSLPDIIFANNSDELYICYNNGNMNFASQSYLFNGEVISWLDIADINSDGLADIMYINNNGEVKHRLGSINPYANLATAVLISTVQPFYNNYRINDIDNDGDMDLVYYETRLSRFDYINVLENIDMQFWQNHTIHSSEYDIVTGMGDINADGFDDFLFIDRDTNNIYSIINRSAGTPNSGNKANNYETQLIGNYPNPFNPDTEISFSLSMNDEIELAIYNIKGQKVNTLIKGNLSEGNHSIVWDGKDSAYNSVSSGVYFYKLTTSKTSETKKMLLLK